MISVFLLAVLIFPFSKVQAADDLQVRVVSSGNFSLPETR